MNVAKPSDLLERRLRDHSSTPMMGRTEPYGDRDTQLCDCKAIRENIRDHCLNKSAYYASWRKPSLLLLHCDGLHGDH